MKISTKSFTYKLIQQYSNNWPSSDLCDYFWQAVWSWGKGIALWWMIASFVFMDLLTITLFFIEGFSNEAIRTSISVFASMLVHYDSLTFNIIAAIFWFFGCVSFLVVNVGIALATVAYIFYSISLLFPEKEDDEDRGVIKEYYKSLKGKYCTQIEFIDE